MELAQRTFCTWQPTSLRKDEAFRLRCCGMGDPFTGDQRGHQQHDEGRGLLFSWLTSLRISSEDAREYTNALVALGFDDLQSIREVRSPKKYVFFLHFLPAPVVEPADALGTAAARSLPGVGSCSRRWPAVGLRASFVSCAAVPRAFGRVRSSKKWKNRGEAHHRTPRRLNSFSFFLRGRFLRGRIAFSHFLVSLCPTAIPLAFVESNNTDHTYREGQHRGV